MNPFNLEEAKAGRAVCTRDGRDVRIICFDRKHTNYPIVALMENKEGSFIFSYNSDGEVAAHNNILNLMMKGEVHEGWVNIYAFNPNNKAVIGIIYPTRQEALDHKFDVSYVDTVKITWEE